MPGVSLEVERWGRLKLSVISPEPSKVLLYFVTSFPSVASRWMLCSLLQSKVQRVQVTQLEWLSS